MSITTLQTNGKNDLFLPDGMNIGILKGQLALDQEIQNACRMVKGENIFNIEEGVDYMGTVFSSPRDLDAARASIANAIISFDDVLSIDSLSIELVGEDLLWDARILTTYGYVQTGSAGAGTLLSFGESTRGMSFENQRTPGTAIVTTANGKTTTADAMKPLTDAMNGKQSTKSDPTLLAQPTFKTTGYAGDPLYLTLDATDTISVDWQFSPDMKSWTSFDAQNSDYNGNRSIEVLATFTKAGDSYFRAILIGRDQNLTTDIVHVVLKGKPVMPAFTTQPPQNISYEEGASVTIAAVASGNEIKYRAQASYDNGASWIDLWSVPQDKAELIFNPAYKYDTGQYRFIATNAAGSVTSTATNMVITGVHPPTLDHWTGWTPSDKIITGNDVYIEAYGRASTANPPQYQWQSSTDGVAWAAVSDIPNRITGSQSPRLTILGAQLSDTKIYQCRIYNAGGETLSYAVRLSVTLPLPVVTLDPQSVGPFTLKDGDKLTLKATVTGQGATWQWYFRKAGDTIRYPIGAPNATSIDITAVSGESGQYNVNATNAAAGGGVTDSPWIDVTVTGYHKLPALDLKQEFLFDSANHPNTVGSVALSVAFSLTPHWDAANILQFGTTLKAKWPLQYHNGQPVGRYPPQNQITNQFGPAFQMRNNDFASSAFAAQAGKWRVSSQTTNDAQVVAATEVFIDATNKAGGISVPDAWGYDGFDIMTGVAGGSPITDGQSIFDPAAAHVIAKPTREVIKLEGIFERWVWHVKGLTTVLPNTTKFILFRKGTVDNQIQFFPSRVIPTTLAAGRTYDLVISMIAYEDNRQGRAGHHIVCLPLMEVFDSLQTAAPHFDRFVSAPQHNTVSTANNAYNQPIETIYINQPLRTAAGQKETTIERAVFRYSSGLVDIKQFINNSQITVPNASKNWGDEVIEEIDWLAKTEHFIGFRQASQVSTIPQQTSPFSPTRIEGQQSISMRVGVAMTLIAAKYRVGGTVEIPGAMANCTYGVTSFDIAEVVQQTNKSTFVITPKEPGTMVMYVESSDFGYGMLNISVVQ